MFKTSDRIYKAIDMVVKATSELGESGNTPRVQQAVNAAHVLSKLHSDCLADMKSENNSEFTE